MPVFIIGNPRSGTSLLRLILTQHTLISIPPECHFFLWLENKYRGWSIQEGYDDLIEDLYQSRKFDTWGINRIKFTGYLKDNSASSYKEFVESVYTYYGLKVKKEKGFIWGDKNKLWKEKLPTIVSYFPDAKFIHLVRDGRDVATSFQALGREVIKSKYAPNLPIEINKIAERWKVNVNYISVFLEKISTEQQITVRYEDILSQPEATIYKIISFLNLPFEDNLLKYHISKKIELYEPKEFLQWKKKLLNPIDRNNLGKFKKLLSSKEIEIFETICSEELQKYGYQ